MTPHESAAPIAPRAAILVTGDEVLLGRVGERNAAPLAASLDTLGVDVRRVVVVGDALAEIAGALEELVSAGVDLVVTTGGLGPTHDDRTMEAVAHAAKRPLELDRQLLEVVRAARAPLRRRESVSEATRRAVEEKQATLPSGAHPLAPAGTAPGCVVEMDETVVCVLPGPPWEAQSMWRAALDAPPPPLAAVLARGAPGPRCLVQLDGVVESEVVQALDSLPAAVREALDIGICARVGATEVAARGASEPLEILLAALRATFAGAVSPQGVRAAEAVGDLLRRRGETLAVAESCTGGLLGGEITSVAGSSGWFLGGVVAYDNDVKSGVLGVPSDVLARHGAVSEEAARHMARGICRLTGASWGLSVTGVAGPGGGTPEKPVGLVCLGLAGPCGVLMARESRIRGPRERVREAAVAAALDLLQTNLRAAAPPVPPRRQA